MDIRTRIGVRTSGALWLSAATALACALGGAAACADAANPIEPAWAISPTGSADGGPGSDAYPSFGAESGSSEAASGEAGGGEGGGSSGLHPDFGTTVTLTQAPPAISGGTLLVTVSGTSAVASDPDRDQV